MNIPSQKDLVNPTLLSIHEAGGSASIDEINELVTRRLNLPAEIVDLPHGRGSRTEVEYRIAWVRTELKKYGLLANSERGVWSLTTRGQETTVVNPDEVMRYNREQERISKQLKVRPVVHEKRLEIVAEFPEDDDINWQEQVIETLLDMSPDAFERLCQRVLRESGFIEVVVTGRSGDGGIDGHGIMRMGGLISFPVLFQSKRHRDTVSSSTIRDFRGAMQGRSDKGIVITTGRFTRDAKQEATRDGAPPIDLIDGNQLAEILKEYNLGIEVERIEKVTVNPEWFANF